MHYHPPPHQTKNLQTQFLRKQQGCLGFWRKVIFKGANEGEGGGANKIKAKQDTQPNLKQKLIHICRVTDILMNVILVQIYSRHTMPFTFVYRTADISALSRSADSPEINISFSVYKCIYKITFILFMILQLNLHLQIKKKKKYQIQM